MASFNAALDFLERKYGNPSQPPASDGGVDPVSAPTPRQGAQMIDFETPLPDWQPSAGAVDMPPEQDQTMVPLQDEEPAQDYAPPRVSRVEQGDTFNAALDFLTRKYGDPQQAATQQAVAEATTPAENLPVLKSDLANALGVLDYRDPEEGQRRQQAAAIGEILGLPEYEKVQLGAAPVNADGTVTIRRAQAVSPEANAAAAAKLQEEQTAAAVQYKAEQEGLDPSFFDKLKQRWRLGREQAVDDQLAYRAMMGEVDYEKVKGQLEPSTRPLKGGNWLSEGVLSATQMLPAMVDGLVSGNTLGLKGAMTAGTAAAIAGQVGPQVVTPEEIVTVPAAAAVGYTAGTAAGSADYWYKQGAGSMYHELRKEGVPHNISSTVAASFGAPYAAIELAQVSKLVPGVKQTAAQAVAGGIKSRLTALAKEKGVEYVEQIGQETTQELLSISGEKLAEWSAGVTPPKDKASAWDRIASTIQQTATSIPFLMAPKAAVDTYQTVRGNEQTPTAPPPPETAPAEVPQNFTPISSPAPSAPGQAPRTLGQVRAPEIPIDQTALDEAFGSTFAPPPDVSNDTFAPPAAVNPAENTTETIIPSQQPTALDTQANDNSILTNTNDTTSTRGAKAKDDSPESALGHLRTSVEAIRGASPRRSEFSLQFEGLVDWATKTNRLDSNAVAPRPADSKGQEHEVWFDDNSKRVLKATYPQSFGNIISEDGVGAPAAYLERLALQNEFFGDDVRVERIVNENGKLRVVTSQPYITGKSATDSEIESYFENIGFKPYSAGGKNFFYNPEHNLLAFDAHRGNLINQDGNIIPIDVGIQKATPEIIDKIGIPSPVAVDSATSPEIPPNTSTAPAAASGAPASTGSPDLITGEGASVSPTAVLPSPETTPAATAPRPFSDLMAENMKRKGEAGYIDLGVVQDFGQSIYQTGMDFAAWSGRMVQKFGETIRDVLASLWQAVSGGQYLPQARERGSVNISPGTGPKPRKFGQSLQAAPGVAPEVKSRLTSLDYDPVSNAQTLANARARIDSAGSIDTAFTDLMGKPAIEGWQPTAEDYATGMELMAQLQNRSRHADAASIANMMATRATDQGRAIQALSMIGRLGPQGIELFAQSQLQAAATKPAKTDKQKADIQAKITEAGQLQGEVDKLRRDSTTAAIVGNKDLIKSSLPAGVDAVQVNIAIREAILGAPTPLAAQAATSSILTGQGLSDKGAARISGSIVRDFLKTTQDTRATVLQDLLATADSDRRLDKSKLGSLIRLNREGKLTDASLHAGMAKMLGIPHWSAEHSAKVRRILAQHEKATDPRIKLVKAAEALDVVYRDFMPPGFLDKVDTFQTLMMLLNTKTVERNVIGNTIMATADLAADAVSVPMDALVSLGTGERTRTGLSLGERLMGLGAGVGDIKAGYDFARSEGRGRIGSIAEGVDTLVRLGRLQSSGKYNASDISALSGPTFTAPGFRHLEATLGLVLSITDRGFYESAFRASLDTRMKAAAANGNPMLAPDTDMVTAARMDAGRAIYQDPNAASRTLGGLRRVLNFNQRWGIGSLLMKFTQVPGSILTRAVEFSPLGFINTAYQSLAPMLSNSREFDQKAFTDSFSRALVGTTGLVATGYWLAHLGIISAGSDSKDEDKRNLNRAMGWGSYKLNVDALKRALMTGNFWTPQKRRLDDKVIGYDWAQPLSIGVAMGAYSRENQEAIKQDILQGKKQSLAATGLNWLAYAGGAATGAMNSLVEQPLLTGLNQFARDVGYDNIPGALLKTAADAPGTFIPTAARQWMQLTDNAVRETRDSSPARQFINELKAQLPGQSQTLPQKYDITGQPIERWAKDSNTLFNVLFNPSMVSYIKGSPALTEMSQVYKYTAEAGAIPNQVKPEFTVEGVKVRLTSEEISAMQKDMGALSIAALEKFVLSDPRYDKATWDIKAKAMTRALEKASTAAKYRILLARPDLKDRAKQEFINLRAARDQQQALME
jgi:hypothetical protein